MHYKTYKGFFTPKNPKKYKGDPTKIIYRSRWEKDVMKYLDENTSVIEWQSEEIAIPYISPLDNRYHRYFPDFLIKIREADGKIKTIMIEVKPLAQTREPKAKKRKTKQYITEVSTWAVNTAKWKSAREYCENRGWSFQFITERELGL